MTIERLVFSAVLSAVIGTASAFPAFSQGSLSPSLTPSSGDVAEDIESVTDVTGPLSESDHGIACEGDKKPCMITQTEQPFRILPRTHSSLLREPSEDSSIRVSNMTGFAPLYVYGISELDLSDAVEPQGFYQVGRTKLGPDGYLRARDALEWRQALILEFEHPGQGEDRRAPTLFFKTQKDLRTIARSDDRKADVIKLRSRISGGESEGGVIAREPAAYADITNDLYIYPILDWKRDEDTDEQARYLRVLTSVPGERVAPEESPAVEGKIIEAGGTQRTLADMSVDVVFVLDMTGSMQPYIDAVKEALVNSAEAFDDEFAGAKEVNFGLIGFRDDNKKSPGLEFTTKNFTGDELVNRENLTDILENDGENLVSKPSPDEWAEAVLPGVKSAIEEAPWTRGGSFKIVALIGDASGHESTGEMDSESLRQYATDNDVYILSVYLQNARAQEDWAAASKQFATLSTNPGATAANFGEVSADTPFMLEALLMNFAYDSRTKAEEALAEQNAISDGKSPEEAAKAAKAKAKPSATPDEDGDLTDKQKKQVEDIAESWGEGLKLGIVDYLGSGQTPPADFAGWVLDNDLENPNRRAVGVRVLVSKAELDTIIRRLEFLLNSLEESEVSEIGFFEALQDLSVRAGLDIEVEESQKFRSSNLLPKWIGAMPYKSEVLDLTPRMFEEMTTQDRAAFKRRNNSKLEAYRAIMAKSDGWRPLDPEADQLENVYPLDINALP